MRKYTEMSKTEYDSVLRAKYGVGVSVVDMGDGTYQIMRFVGYEDGDPEYECSDSYPKAYGANEDVPNEMDAVSVEGIDGVVFA